MDGRTTEIRNVAPGSYNNDRQSMCKAQFQQGANPSAETVKEESARLQPSNKYIYSKMSLIFKLFIFKLLYGVKIFCRLDQFRLILTGAMYDRGVFFSSQCAQTAGTAR